MPPAHVVVALLGVVLLSGTQKGRAWTDTTPAYWRTTTQAYWTTADPYASTLPARQCPGEEFECDNGACVHPNYVCDGRDHCGDGSDENADLCQGTVQGSLFGVPLGASETLEVAVGLLPNTNPFRASGALSVALCGPRSCSGHQLSGLSDKVAPASQTFVSRRNNIGSGVSVTQNFDGVSFWEPMLLEVEKHNRLLSVWPSGRPDLKRWTECRLDETHLVVSSTGLGNTTLHQSGAPLAAGRVLKLGEQVDVEMVVSSRGVSSLAVGLCSARTCAAVTVWAPLLNGGRGIQYAAGFTRTNNPEEEFDEQIHIGSKGTYYWTPNRYQFTVALHPFGYLQVWQAEDPDTVVEVPVPEDVKKSPVLKVVPTNANVGYQSMGVKTKRQLPHVKSTYHLRV